MIKRIMIGLDKSRNCGQCKFSYKTNFGNLCICLDKYVGVMSTDEECPIEDLKPQGLTWAVGEGGDYVSINSSQDSQTYTISTRHGWDYMSIKCGKTEINHSIKIQHDDKINKSIKVCQDHYDKIFYEMIGVNI